MSDDEDNECPLCMEQYSEDDLRLRPCPCGYQVCLWCLRKLQEMSGKCPACRRKYEEENITYRTDDELAELTRHKKSSSKNTGKTPAGFVKRQSQTSLQQGRAAAAKRAAAISAKYGKKRHPNYEERRRLANVRVIQRTLLYVIGIAPKIAREETLRRHEYFGQYGEIVKVVVNRSYINGSHNSASAYITFARPEDAREAIRCVDGITVLGRQMRASYGTTKYCNAFLRGAACPNPECLYLHTYGDEDDSFTKEEMMRNKGVFQAQIHPKRDPDAADMQNSEGLPPPSLEHQQHLQKNGSAAGAAEESVAVSNGSRQAQGSTSEADAVPATVGATQKQQPLQKALKGGPAKPQASSNLATSFAAKAAASLTKKKKKPVAKKRVAQTPGPKPVVARSVSAPWGQQRTPIGGAAAAAAAAAPSGKASKSQAQLQSRNPSQQSRPQRAQQTAQQHTEPQQQQQQQRRQQNQQSRNQSRDVGQSMQSGQQQQQQQQQSMRSFFDTRPVGPTRSQSQPLNARPLQPFDGLGASQFADDDFPGLPTQGQAQQPQPAALQGGFHDQPPGLFDTRGISEQQPQEHQHQHQPPLNFQQQKLLSEAPRQPAAAQQWLQSVLPGVNVTFGGSMPATPPAGAESAGADDAYGEASRTGQLDYRRPVVEDGAAAAWGFGDLPDVSQLLLNPQTQPAGSNKKPSQPQRQQPGSNGPAPSSYAARSASQTSSQQQKRQRNKQDNRRNR